MHSTALLLVQQRESVDSCYKSCGLAHWVGLACWLRRVLPTSWVVTPLVLASEVSSLVAPPLERLHLVPPFEGLLVVAFSADKEEVVVLAVRLLCVGNSAVGAVGSGSVEELTVNPVSLAHPQPQKIPVSDVLALPEGII